MTEDNEMIDLLKELVSRLQQLENAVYDDENLLMKSGIVKVESPRPRMGEHSSVPDGEAISKMSWKDINDLVTKMGGQ